MSAAEPGRQHGPGGVEEGHREGRQAVGEGKTETHEKLCACDAAEEAAVA